MGGLLSWQFTILEKQGSRHVETWFAYNFEKKSDCNHFRCPPIGFVSSRATLCSELGDGGLMLADGGDAALAEW